MEECAGRPLPASSRRCVSPGESGLEPVVLCVLRLDQPAALQSQRPCLFLIDSVSWISLQSGKIHLEIWNSFLLKESPVPHPRHVGLFICCVRMRYFTFKNLFHLDHTALSFQQNYIWLFNRLNRPVSGVCRFTFFTGCNIISFTTFDCAVYLAWTGP